MVQQSEFLPVTEYKSQEEGLVVIQQPSPQQNFSSLLGPEDKDTPLYKTWSGVMPSQGQTVTYSTDSGYPDYWYVYVLSTWSGTQGQYQPSLVGVTQGGGAARSAEIYLSGGGVCRIPGNSDFITLEARVIGTNPVYYGVLAVRKSDIDIIITPGSG